jgi:hypothetical protein
VNKGDGNIMKHLLVLLIVWISFCMEVCAGIGVLMGLLVNFGMKWADSEEF